MLLSVKILLKFPLYTIGAALQLASVALLLMFTVLGAFLFLPGFYCLFTELMTTQLVQETEGKHRKVEAS